MKSDRDPKMMDPQKYKNILENNLGKNIKVDYITAGRVSKSIEGVVLYVSSTLFGIKVILSNDSYVTSLSFIDLFTGKAKIYLED